MRLLFHLPYLFLSHIFVVVVVVAFLTLAKTTEALSGDRAGAFIGSGTVLCAPAEVGDGAMTAAGAVVRPGSNIGADELWLGVPARYLRQRALPPKKEGTKA